MSVELKNWVNMWQQCEKSALLWYNDLLKSLLIS